MLNRRDLLIGSGAVLAGTGRCRAGAAEAAPGPLASTFARIERESGGRLGVAVLDTGSGRRTGYRADERFPLCSTVKALIGAAVLARVDAGSESLERRIVVAPSDLLSYAPITKQQVGGPGMTVAALCEAALTVSDNTAANLLVASLGGPAAVTAYARTLGDTVTRLDRTEPTLNEALPGDPRDTTTPDAMAGTLRRLVLGDALSAASRDRLTAWMVACTTGLSKLRAGLPSGWRVADKTGSGERGSFNDVAVLWRPDGAPLVVTVYMTGTTVTPEAANPLFAAIAKAIAAA